MKHVMIAAVVAAVLGVGGLALAQHEGHEGHGKKGPTTAPTSQATTRASAKPINQYCAINSDEKIDPKVTTVYKGKTIGFCCEDCIEKFNKDPEKYMKTLK